MNTEERLQELENKLAESQRQIERLVNFCFTQSTEFQTYVFENVLARLESGVGLGIGKRLPSDYCALFDVQSLTKGIRFPNMTTGQRDAIVNPQAGLVIFNTSTSVLNYYSGSAWAAV